LSTFDIKFLDVKIAEEYYLDVKRFEIERGGAR